MATGNLIPRIPTDPPIFVASDPGFENTVAQELGDVNAAFSDFDVLLAATLAALDPDIAALASLDSLLADLAFTPGALDSSVLLPVVQDAVDLQASGDSIVGTVDQAPQSANPLDSPDTFQPLSIGTLPRGMLKHEYEFDFLFIGGLPPYKFALSPVQPAPTAGWLIGIPPGLALSSDGKLTGTPTKVGQYAFALAVTDAGPSGGTWEYTLQIVSGWGA